MGDLFSLFCQDCGYEVELLSGIGMMYSSLENVLFLVSKARREKVKKLIQREDLSEVHYKQTIYSCPDCSLQESRLNYRIEYGEGEVYQPYFLCSRCRTRLAEDDQPRLTDHCPVCDSKNVLTGYGIWD
jgi:DNA-directed RNA polymerase subunit RPC12/RpoP